MKETANWYRISKVISKAGLLLALLPAYAVAQQDTIHKLNEVNISTLRSELLRSNTPAQQLSSSQFVRYSAFNVADALRGFSGVNVKDYGGVGGLKTVSVRGLGANHTTVLLDGIQVSDAENGQIDLGKFNLNNVSAITLYNAQPADILMPARSFASASVISISTTRPVVTPEAPYRIVAGLLGGSFGLVNPYVQWQQRLTGKWSFIVNAYTTYAHGRYKYSLFDGSNYTRDERLGATVRMQQADGALYFNGNDSSSFNLRVNYYHADRGVPGAVITGVPPRYGQRLWNNDFFAQTGYKKSWMNGLRLMLNAKYANNYLHYFDPTFGNAAGYLDQHFRQQEYYQSAAVAYTITKDVEISYAADLIINSLTANLPGFKYPTRTTILNVVAANFNTGKLTLQGSLLNTNLVETVASGTTIPHRNIFSPTLIAGYQFSDAFNIRAFYKNIFRAPTFNELYYNFITNTNLKPETAHQFNIGAVYNRTLNGALKYITFTTDVYYNRVIDKIIYTPNIYAGSALNIAKAGGIGTDIGLRTEGRLGGGYSGILAVNYSYQRAMNISGPASSTYKNQLPYTPRHLINVNTGISKNGWGLYYNHLFSSLRFYDNNNKTDFFYQYLPAYGLVDLSLVYKGSYASLPFTVSAAVNNLLNQNYVVVQSYPMPGRSIRVLFQITI